MSEPSNEPTVGRCTIRQAAIIIGAQSAVVLLAAGLLLLVLRGSPPDQAEFDRYHPTYDFGSMPTFAPKVVPQWASKEELLAAAPREELIGHNVALGNVEFQIDLPADGRITEPYDQGFWIETPGSKVHVEFGFANFDLLRNEQYDAKDFPFLDEGIFVVETISDSERRYRFHANRKFGLIQIRAGIRNPYGEADHNVSLENCLLMLRCLESLRIVNGAPENLVDAIVAVGGKVHTNFDGEVDGVDLNYVETCPEIVQRLDQFPAMKWLRLGDHELSPQSLQVLTKLPELTELHAGDYSVLGAEGFAFVCQCEKLEVFIGNLESIDPRQWNDFAELTRLRRIELNGIDEQPVAGVATLGKLTELEDIALSQRGPDDWPLAFLAQLPKLRRLELHGEMSEQSIAELARNGKTITELRLFSTALTDSDMKELCQLKQLESLFLWNFDPMEFEDEFIETLDASSAETEVSAAGLAHLKNLTNLQSFIYHNSQFDDSALDVFLQLPNLANLELSGSKITDTGVLKLATHAPLKRLVLHECEQVTREGIREFRRVRPDVMVLK